MTRDLILKPALGIFLKFKTYPKKRIDESGRQEILNFPFIPIFFIQGGVPRESRRKKNS